MQYGEQNESYLERVLENVPLGFQPEGLLVVRFSLEEKMMNKVKIPYGSMTNQCPTCGELFKSVYAFDKHRTGSFHPPERRCLSIEEMTAKGMQKNSHGHWISAPNTNIQH